MIKKILYNFNKSSKLMLLMLAVLGSSVEVFAQAAPPSGDPSQYFCSQASWANGGITVSQGDVLTDLLIYGENLTWYADNNGTPGAVINNPDNEVMIDGATYYVTQTPAGGSESNPLAVEVTDRECGCLRNGTFETQDGQQSYEGYTFYSQSYQVGHKTCGGSTVGAPTIPNGDSEASILPTGTDPVVTNTSLSTTNPDNPFSEYALRLNDAANGRVSHASKEFVAGEVFVFNFTMVLDNPPNYHSYNELPHFQVRIYDENDELYATRCIISQPTDCIFAEGAANLLYSEWSCVKINTLGIIGRKARVEFTTTDCTLGGHSGYTYIDDLFVGDEADTDCDDPAFGYVAIESLASTGANGEESCVVGQQSSATVACAASGITEALPFPIEVCGSYVLPVSSGNPPTIDDFKLDIVQNNSVVGTLNNPVLDPATGTFCFTVDASDVNVSPYGEFSFETYAAFGLNCGFPQTIPIDDRSSVDICPEAGCPNALTVCDDTGSGVGTFDLTQSSPEIIDQWTVNDLDITYYTDQDDALDGVNEISDPSNYNNSTPGEEIVFARVDWNPSGATGSSCYYLVEIPLMINPIPDVNLDDTTICGSNTAISTNIVATPNNLSELDNVSYVWFKDGTQIPTTGSFINVTEPGQYTVTVSNNGCEVTESVEVNIVEFDVDLGDDPVNICGEDGSYTITANIIDNSNPAIDQSELDYSWSNGETTKEITVTESGNYFVDVTYENCTETAAVSVFIATQPEVSLGQDIVICSGESSQITASVANFSDPSILDYEWTRDGVVIAGENSSVLDVVQEGTYAVFVNEMGVDDCQGTDQVDFSFYANENCVITQGLSPDTTPGQNDCLDLAFLNDRTGIKKLSLFNRYGRIIFEKNNYSNTWCGQDNDGNDLATGTYYYVIELNGEDPVFGTSEKGWIYLNREVN